MTSAAATQQAAAEQSAAITRATTTVEEIKAIALQTAHQAGKVAHDSQNALTVARQGTQAVEETVQGVSQIRLFQSPQLRAGGPYQISNVFMPSPTIHAPQHRPARPRSSRPHRSSNRPWAC